MTRRKTRKRRRTLASHTITKPKEGTYTPKYILESGTTSTGEITFDLKQTYLPEPDENIHGEDYIPPHYPPTNRQMVIEIKLRPSFWTDDCDRKQFTSDAECLSALQTVLEAINETECFTITDLDVQTCNFTFEEN